MLSGLAERRIKKPSPNGAVLLVVSGAIQRGVRSNPRCRIAGSPDIPVPGRALHAGLAEGSLQFVLVEVKGTCRDLEEVQRDGSLQILRAVGETADEDRVEATVQRRRAPVVRPAVLERNTGAGVVLVDPLAAAAGVCAATAVGPVVGPLHDSAEVVAEGAVSEVLAEDQMGVP